MRRFIFSLVLLLGVIMYIPTYSETDDFSQTEQISTHSIGIKIVNNAMNYLGLPYKWGAVGPKSFDCSGFMMWLFKQEGIKISRTSRQQYYNGTPVERTELKPGDLIFFARNKSPKSIYHVGMVVEEDSTGNNKFIHSTRGGVKISSLTGHYSKKYFAARRIISSQG